MKDGVEVRGVSFEHTQIVGVVAGTGLGSFKFFDLGGFGLRELACRDAGTGDLKICMDIRI